jgi:hypothetical protein
MELLELLHMKEGTGAADTFCQLVTLINKFDLRLEKKKWLGLFDTGLRLRLAKTKATATFKKIKELQGKTSFLGFECILHQ